MKGFRAITIPRTDDDLASVQDRLSALITYIGSTVIGDAAHVHV